MGLLKRFWAWLIEPMDYHDEYDSTYDYDRYVAEKDFEERL